MKIFMLPGQNKAVRRFCLLLTAFVLVGTGLAFAGYSLERQSINQGGVSSAVSGTSGYTMGMSAGQKGTGVSNSGLYELKAGFWQGPTAPPGETASIYIPDTSGCQGDQIAVPVIANGLTNLAGLNLRIGYDNAVLVPSGDTVVSNYILSPLLNVPTGNYLNIVWDGDLNNPLNIPDGDTLMMLVFDIIGTSGSVSPLAWDQAFSILFDNLGNVIPSTFTDGSVSVVCEPILTIANDTIATVPDGKEYCIPVTVENFDLVGGLNLRICIDTLFVQLSGDTVQSNYITSPTIGVTSGGDCLNIVWDGDLANPLTIPDGETLLCFVLDGICPSDGYGPLVWDTLFSGLFDSVGNSIHSQFIDGSVTGCCVNRGDMDHSGGAVPVDISDLTLLSDYMFMNGSPPICMDEADTNSDCQVDISDLTFIIGFMFHGGPAPGPCYTGP